MRLNWDVSYRSMSRIAVKVFQKAIKLGKEIASSEWCENPPQASIFRLNPKNSEWGDDKTSWGWKVLQQNGTDRIQ